eukprot:1188122-Prorocentrum_minimum.AAC.1
MGPSPRGLISTSSVPPLTFLVFFFPSEDPAVPAVPGVGGMGGLLPTDFLELVESRRSRDGFRPLPPSPSSADPAESRRTWSPGLPAPSRSSLSRRSNTGFGGVVRDASSPSSALAEGAWGDSPR